MDKLDFKKYYESKLKLIEAVDSSPKIKIQYKLNKYCKIPLLESIDSDRKIYVGLKPDDIIEFLWEYDSPDNPLVRYLKIGGSTFFPLWNSSKMLNWVINNTDEI